MDEIRKFAVELAVRRISGNYMTAGFGPVDSDIEAARKWEAYLREPVPHDGWVDDPVVAEDDKQLDFFEEPKPLTDAEVHALSLGMTPAEEAAQDKRVEAYLRSFQQDDQTRANYR